VQEFFPTVSLGDPALESLLTQHGLKVGTPARASAMTRASALTRTLAPQDKAPLRRSPDAVLPRLLRALRQLSRPFSGPAVLWSLYLVAATACLLRALSRRRRGAGPPARHKGPRRGEPADRGGGERNGQLRRKEGEERGETRARGAADSPRGPKKKK